MDDRCVADCELCQSPGGAILWEDDFCRIVSVADPDYPGFCRVIIHRHVAEMSDLDAAGQQRLMHVVFTLESVLRNVFQPDKVNLASFGNLAPHVHWHVVPRWRSDRHFPNPVWGTAQRVSSPPRLPVDPHRLSAAIGSALGSASPRCQGE